MHVGYNFASLRVNPCLSMPMCYVNPSIVTNHVLVFIVAGLMFLSEASSFCNFKSDTDDI